MQIQYQKRKAWKALCCRLDNRSLFHLQKKNNQNFSSRLVCILLGYNECPNRDSVSIWRKQLFYLLPMKGIFILVLRSRLFESKNCENYWFIFVGICKFLTIMDNNCCCKILGKKCKVDKNLLIMFLTKEILLMILVRIYNLSNKVNPGYLLIITCKLCKCYNLLLQLTIKDII